MWEASCLMKVYTQIYNGYMNFYMWVEKDSLIGSVNFCIAKLFKIDVLQKFALVIISHLRQLPDN